MDAIGNLIGRYPALTNIHKPKTLLLGSHLDTVCDAGKFDGPLGVLLAIAWYSISKTPVRRFLLRLK